jgi:hypothetical protein
LGIERKILLSPLFDPPTFQNEVPPLPTLHLQVLHFTPSGGGASFEPITINVCFPTLSIVCSFICIKPWVFGPVKGHS